MNFIFLSFCVHLRNVILYSEQQLRIKTEDMKFADLHFCVGKH